MNYHILRVLALGFVGGALVASCGGGSVTAPTNPSPTPTATAAPASTTFAISQAGSTAQLPSLNGLSGSITIPANNAPAGTTMTITLLSGALSGGPQSSSRRIALVSSPKRPAQAGTTTVLYSLEITVSQTLSFTGFPGFSLTLPTSISTSGENFSIAAYQGTSSSAPLLATLGPATVSGQTITFAPTTTAITLTSGQTYLLELDETSSSPTASPSTSPSSSPTPTSSPTPLPTPSPSGAPAGTLYVGNGANSSIEVYAPNATGSTAPLFTIAGSNTGLSGPTGMTADAKGNVYVVMGPNTIESFPYGANGNVAPTTILTSDPGPWGLAIDPSGNLVATDFRNNVVDFFAPSATGSDAPIHTFAGIGLFYPYQAAFDGSGNLYVLNGSCQSSCNGSVSIFAPSGGGNYNITPTGGITSSMDGPEALAVDSSGRVYVGNSGNNTITVYAPGNYSLVATLSGNTYNFSINQASLSVDAQGNLYVASASYANSVYVFAPITSSTPTLLRTLNGSTNSQESAAVVP